MLGKTQNPASATVTILWDPNVALFGTKLSNDPRNRKSNLAEKKKQKKKKHTVVAKVTVKDWEG